MKPILIFTALLLAALTALQAEAPNPGRYSAEKFEVKATRGNKAAMRDGVKLSVDVAQPQAAGRFPAILIITPYSNNPGFQKRAVSFSLDGEPIIGPVPGVEGLYAGICFHSGGFSYNPASGRFLAEYVAHGAPSLDLHAFRPDRFTAADTAAYLATPLTQAQSFRRRH